MSVPPGNAPHSAPMWLREPADVNALLPHLWSRTAHKVDGVLHVGGMAVPDLVANVNTPAYVLDEVHGLWGPELELRPPSGTYDVVEQVRDKTRVRDAAGNETETEVERDVATGKAIRLEGSDLHARLHLVQRRKGLLWFPTYDVELTGTYRFVNDGGAPRRIDFTLPLPTDRTVFDGFSVLDEDRRVGLARVLPVLPLEQQVGATEQRRQVQRCAA